jgi:hypothetical protein
MVSSDDSFKAARHISNMAILDHGAGIEMHNPAKNMLDDSIYHPILVTSSSEIL